MCCGEYIVNSHFTTGVVEMDGRGGTLDGKLQGTSTNQIPENKTAIMRSNNI